MNENEVWKDVVGFEGYYKVSDKGNVYSVVRMVRGRKCGGIMLKPRYDKDGYLRVTLYKNGEQRTIFIHRLVLEAFVENPKNLPEVNHIDENKTNNELSNLEWCTSRHNTNHGTLIERLSKKVRAVNVETGEVLTFSSVKEAGRKGYDRGAVSRASRGDYYDGRIYKGHIWYYE